LLKYEGKDFMSKREEGRNRKEENRIKARVGAPREGRKQLCLVEVACKLDLK
jgi:hypothetical protein